MAARVGLVSESSDGAGTIDQTVALVALFADADVLVEQPALGVHFAASSVDVEVESDRAGKTGVTVPLCAAEVIVEGHQDGWVVGDQILHLLGRWSRYCVAVKACLGKHTRC